MKSSTKGIALILLAVVVVIPSSRAEWIAQDLSVCTAPGTQCRPAIATDNLGNTFIAWLDYRSNPDYADNPWDYIDMVNNAIYMQKFDAAGTACWVPNGVSVTSMTRQKGNLRIAPDDLGGAYIAFEIDSAGTWGCYDNSVSRIALSRVSPDGTVQWSKYVSNASTLCSEESPTMLYDGSGGVVLIWALYKNFHSYDCGNEWGILCCYWSSTSICAQRMDSEGGRPWGLSPLTLSNGGSISEVRAVKIDSSQAIVVWAAGDIFAQKLGMDGNLFWGAAGTTVCASSGTQSGPSVRPDGLGGAIIAWCDGRTVQGVTGHPYIYAQRLDTAGIPLWVPNGVQIGSAQGAFIGTAITPEQSGEWIVSWTNSTSIGSTPCAQKIDIEGNILWSPDGIPVSTAANSRAEYLLAVPDGEGGAVFAWDKMTPYAAEPTLRGIWGTSASDIFTVGDRGCIYHYDGLEWTRMESGATANLNGVWGFASDDVYAVGAGGVILHYDGLEWSPMASPTTKDMRGVWGSSTSDVFAAGASGTIIHYDGVAWNSMSYSLGGEIYGIHGTSSANVYAVGEYGYGAMTLHYDGVTWTRSLRDGCWYRSVWIRPDGEIFMGGFYGAIGKGAVFHDSGEGVEVIPIDAREIGWGVWGSSSSDVYVALHKGSLAHYDGSTWSVNKVSTQGLNAVWGANGSDIWVAGNQLAVRHFDGSEWVPQMQQNFDLYAQRLDATGARLWLDEGAPVTVGMDDQAQKTLVLDGDGAAVLAWKDGRSGNWDILSRKVSIPRGPTVATELLAFGAERAGAGIRIAWELSRFDEGARFDITRMTDPERGTWNAISPAVERKGFAFGFIDSGLKPGAGYKYRVAVSDTKGERVLFETEAISVPAPPLTLSQNFPNPFNPMTAIQYSLPEKCRVALSIYDVSGKLIARLVDTEQDAGIHRAEWNGRDAHGKQAASGVYFYRLKAGKKTLSRKMVLLL